VDLVRVGVRVGVSGRVSARVGLGSNPNSNLKPWPLLLNFSLSQSVAVVLMIFFYG
jgi:hypothetical protein